MSKDKNTIDADELADALNKNTEMALTKAIHQNALEQIDHKRDLQTVRENIERVHDILKNQMDEDVHYGIIPGTTNKTLFKAGAELIAMNFGVRPEYDIIINKFPPDEYPSLPAAEFHREYDVTCRLFKYFGQGAEVELCQGIGTCSTLESKFRYRYGKGATTDTNLPAGFWDKWKQDKAAAKAMLPKGFGFAKNDNGDWKLTKKGSKEENPDIADVWNTVKKIAKKRAYVDAINTFVAASNIFAKTEDEIETDPEKVKTAVDTNGVSEAEYEEVKPKIEKVFDPYPEIDPGDMDKPQIFIDRIFEYKDFPNGDKMLDSFIEKYAMDLKFFSDTDKKPILDAYSEVMKHFEDKKT